MAVLFLGFCVSILWRLGHSIDCSQTGDCICTANTECDLNCIGKDFCKGDVALQCKSGYPCTITCQGVAACSDTNIDGSSATDVTIICDGIGACKGSGHIRCGTGACQLRCRSSSTACETTNVHFDTAASFQCTGIGCNNNNIPVQFTASPTDVPTLRPTKSPTRIPTDVPSTLPTNVPSDATSSPSNMPTVNTSMPTTFIPSALSTTLGPTSSPSETTSVDATTLPTSLPTTTNTPTGQPTNLPSSTNHTTSLLPTIHTSPTHAPSSAPTSLSTLQPTTSDPMTAEPTTSEPTTTAPTTASPTTADPTTPVPTTSDPTTAEPTTASPTTAGPTTASPTTADLTTASPTTASPTTSATTTSTPTTTTTTTTIASTSVTASTSTSTSATTTVFSTTTSVPTTAIPTTTTSSINTTITQTSSDGSVWICDDDACLDDEEEEDDATITVDVEFAFSSSIVYDLRNIDCFVYQILDEALIENNDFFAVLRVCDIHITGVTGGFAQSGDDGGGVCMHGPPCFSSGINRRRLLQTRDAQVSMALVAETESAYFFLSAVDIETLQIAVQNAFLRDFSLIALISITVEQRTTDTPADESSETELTTENTALVWYIIGSVIAVLLTIGLMAALLMGKKRKRIQRKENENGPSYQEGEDETLSGDHAYARRDTFSIIS